MSKPVEQILLDAARAGGCGDEAAVTQALESAAKTGGGFVDAILDAGVLPDESAFFQHLGSFLRLPFNAVPKLDPQNASHTMLPARLALRHRLLPLRDT